jgi:hypothetical protein
MNIVTISGVLLTAAALFGFGWLARGLKHRADTVASIAALELAAADQKRMLTLSRLQKEQLEGRTAQLDAAHIDLRACELKLAEVTEKNNNKPRIPAPRRPRVVLPPVEHDLGSGGGR